MSVQIFGIRHHGPGCARSLRGALKALKPDIVMVEGPPDATSGAFPGDSGVAGRRLDRGLASRKPTCSA